jgi:hypothetical protein
MRCLRFLLTHACTRYGNHGKPARPAPPSAPFPSVYANDFDGLALNSDEPYLADQAGHWEVRKEVWGAANNVLRHVVPSIGVVYRHDRLPIAVLGNPGWRDLNASLKFRIEDKNADGIYIGVRALNTRTDPHADPAKSVSALPKEHSPDLIDSILTASVSLGV